MKKLITLLIIFIILTTFSHFTFAAEKISISSGAGLLIERSSDRILFEKNAYKKMYPASTTKILTAIVVLENTNLTDTATVSKNALETIPNGYVTCNLQIGEELSIKDLMYALMVKSANDAAVVLAEHVGGSVEGFSDMMNEKAKEIGCKNTHFVNPNGIHNNNHYTTAYDLYLMADYALSFEHTNEFREFVSKTSYTLPATNMYPAEDRSFTTTNELIKINNNDRIDNYYYKNALGIKTGHTSQAGYCLVSSSNRDDLEFISVILDGGFDSKGLSERSTETIKLFDFGYDNFTLTKIKEANNIIDTITVEKATKETATLNLLIKDEITVINDKDTDIDAIEPEITLNENIIAPISKGEVLGTIKYTVDDIEYTSELLAEHDVEKFDITFELIVTGVFLLIIGFLLLVSKEVSSRNRKKKKRKMKKNTAPRNKQNPYKNIY
jgi:D-alanyl-D-alanine carboxypeptidase (penicillin-binding protein 5/6)